MKYVNCSKVILLLLLFTTSLSAQNAKEDFAKVFDRYAGMENFSMKMESFSYESNNAKASSSFTGIFKKKGKDFYSNVWDREMIVNDGKMLLVDHESKKIVLGKGMPEKVENLGFPEFSVDSLEAEGGSIHYRGREGISNVYEILMPDKLLYAMKIYINDAFVITRITYRYQELEEARPAFVKTEIFYKDVHFAPPPESFFDEAKFITKKGNRKASPTAAYASYEVQEVDYTAYNNFQQ